MSGYKRATVSITQDEYDRLRQAEEKLRAIPEIPRHVSQSISERSLLELQSGLTEVSNRQKAYASLATNFHGDLQQLEWSTTQAMLDLESSLYGQAQSLAGTLWAHVDQVIGDHTRNFNTALSAYQKQQQEQISQVSFQVQQLGENNAQKQFIAEDWLVDAEELFQFLATHYEHELFFPNHLQRLERQLDQTRQNLNLGLSEAVIASAQQVFFGLSELHLQLEQAQNEWRMLLLSVWETINHLIILTEQSQVVEAIDLEGVPLPFDIQVEEWWPGRLSQIYQDLTQAKEMVQYEPNQLDNSTLRHWLDEDLPAYYHALEDAVLFARVSTLNAQLRINIADLVIQALQEQGFALEAGDYASADVHNAYEARLMNLEGCEVIVQVAPTGEALGDNELHLQSLDREERSEYELQQRWFEISQSLSAFGLEVGNFVREDAPSYLGEPSRQALPGRLARQRKEQSRSG